MRYFDTSFLVPVFVNERLTVEVEGFLKKQAVGEAAISQWTRIEFSATVARHVRTGVAKPDAALQMEIGFDSFVAGAFLVVAPTSADFDLATRFLRRYETGLRAGDALHLAIASNNGAQVIYSLDRGFLKAGRILGLPVESGIRLP